MLGRKVAELVKAYQKAGYYSLRWDAGSSASGVYYARFTASDELGRTKYSKVNKLLLMK